MNTAFVKIWGQLAGAVAYFEFILSHPDNYQEK